MASQLNMTDYTDPWVTHVDQNNNSNDNNNDYDNDDGDDDDNNNNNANNKKSKCSIFAILTGLLHSYPPYMINHYEHLSYFRQLYNRMTAQVIAFL